MRNIILFPLLLLSTAVSAQKYQDKLKKAKDIFDASMEYLRTRPARVTPADTIHLLVNFMEMDFALSEPMVFGNDADRKLATYYTGIFKFRLGYMFAANDEPNQAIRWYEDAEKDFRKLMEKDFFPVNFTLEDYDYNIDGSYFKTVLPIMYVDMVNSFHALKATIKVEEYARRTLTLKDLSNFEKFHMTAIIIQCLEEKNQEDNETLALYLSMWKFYNVLDTANQHRFLMTDAQLLERVKYLTDKVYANEDNGSTPALVAQTLFELNKNEDAEAFLKLAVQKKPNITLPGFDEDFYYRVMMNAYNYKDKDVMKWASLRLGTSYLLSKKYVKDVVMVLNFLGDREFARIVKKRYK